MLTEIINVRDPKILSLEFALGNTCNYKCSYCFPGSNEGDALWPDIDVLITNVDHLISRYKLIGKEKFEFYLLGGEATLWNDLPKFCNHLKQNHNVKLRISTNASRGARWWDVNARLFDEIEISVHHEYAKISHIIEVADLIYKKKINLSANVLMDPEHFKKCKDIIDELKTSKHKWPIIASSVQYSGETRYSPEQKEYVKSTVKRYPNLFWWWSIKHNSTEKIQAVINNKLVKVKGNWFLLNDLNKFKGWECNLGIDHIEVSPSGSVRGTCEQPIYNGTQFNIRDKEFISKFNPTFPPVICGKDRCFCGHEITISKKIIPILPIN
jgi:MoaA/NifB/PqqE/SkfB family radical SAM enzyme